SFSGGIFDKPAARANEGYGDNVAAQDTVFANFKGRSSPSTVCPGLALREALRRRRFGLLLHCKIEISRGRGTKPNQPGRLRPQRHSQKNSRTSVAVARDWPKATQPCPR